MEADPYSSAAAQRPARTAQDEHPTIDRSILRPYLPPSQHSPDATKLGATALFDQIKQALPASSTWWIPESVIAIVVEYVHLPLCTSQIEGVMGVTPSRSVDGSECIDLRWTSPASPATVDSIPVTCQQPGGEIFGRRRVTCFTLCESVAYFLIDKFPLMVLECDINLSYRRQWSLALPASPTSQGGASTSGYKCQFIKCVRVGSGSSRLLAVYSNNEVHAWTLAGDHLDRIRLHRDFTARPRRMVIDLCVSPLTGDMFLSERMHTELRTVATLQKFSKHGSFVFTLRTVSPMSPSRSLCIVTSPVDSAVEWLYGVDAGSVLIYDAGSGAHLFAVGRLVGGPTISLAVYHQERQIMYLQDQSNRRWSITSLLGASLDTASAQVSQQNTGLLHCDDRVSLSSALCLTTGRIFVHEEAQGAQESCIVVLR